MIQRTILHVLQDILKASKNIEKFVDQMDFDHFEGDAKTIRAVERELEIIGEAVKRLPDDLVHEYPEIPWRAVAGMRDRLIHHYWDTEVEILWKTVQDSIPLLSTIIEKMIENETAKMR